MVWNSYPASSIWCNMLGKRIEQFVSNTPGRHPITPAAKCIWQLPPVMTLYLPLIQIQNRKQSKENNNNNNTREREKKKINRKETSQSASVRHGEQITQYYRSILSKRRTKCVIPCEYSFVFPCQAARRPLDRSCQKADNCVWLSELSHFKSAIHLHENQSM